MRLCCNFFCGWMLIFGVSLNWCRLISILMLECCVSVLIIIVRRWWRGFIRIIFCVLIVRLCWWIVCNFLIVGYRYLMICVWYWCSWCKVFIMGSVFCFGVCFCWLLISYCLLLLKWIMWLLISMLIWFYYCNNWFRMFGKMRCLKGLVWIVWGWC